MQCIAYCNNLDYINISNKTMQCIPQQCRLDYQLQEHKAHRIMRVVHCFKIQTRTELLSSLKLRCFTLHCLKLNRFTVVDCLYYLLLPMGTQAQTTCSLGDARRMEMQNISIQFQPNFFRRKSVHLQHRPSNKVYARKEIEEQKDRNRSARSLGDS